MKKRLISLLLLLALAVSLACPIALADDAASPMASDLITSGGVDLTALGNGQIKISFHAMAATSMKKLGASVVRLFSSSGAVVATYSSSMTGYEFMVASDVSSHSGSIIYSGTAGETYHAVATLYAYDGANSSTKSVTTTFSVTAT